MVALTHSPAPPTPPTGGESGTPLAGPSAADIADVVVELLEQPTAEATTERIAAAAARFVPCTDAGVLLVRTRGQVIAASATSDRAHRALEVVDALGEGPAAATADEEGPVVVVTDTSDEARWPRWADAVAGLGYTSVVSVPLSTQGRRYGSLELLCDGTNALVDAAPRAATFGRLASVALAVAQDRDGLLLAVGGRRMIGIAMGILVERYGLAVETAFQVLVRYSQQHNVKLREVARLLVENGELPGDVLAE